MNAPNRWPFQVKNLPVAKPVQEPKSLPSRHETANMRLLEALESLVGWQTLAPYDVQMQAMDAIDEARKSNDTNPKEIT